MPRWQAPASTAVLDDEFALTVWRQERADGAGCGSAPFLPLVLVGCESRDCMSVELDIAEIEGGALFESFVSLDTGFTRRHNSFAEWVACIAALIGGGAFERLRTRDGGLLLRVPDPAGLEAWDGNRRARAEHPVHGRQTHFSYAVADWPQHYWQHVRRLDDRR